MAPGAAAAAASEEGRGLLDGFDRLAAEAEAYHERTLGRAPRAHGGGSGGGGGGTPVSRSVLEFEVSKVRDLLRLLGCVPDAHL